MRIALTCPASLPATQFGGILFLCVNIANELANLGHDITIFTTDLDFANNPKTFNKKLPRYEIINKFKIVRSHVWFYVGLFYVNFGMYFQMLKEKPDVIHAIGVRSFQSYIAALVSKKLNTPLVISDQGGLTTHPALKKGNIIKRILYNLQSPMIHFIINQASKISVANEYERDIFSKFCDDSKLVVVRNGINLENLLSYKVNFKEKYNITESYLLFLGRFDKVKGIDVLLKALKEIKAKPEMYKTILVIMGVDFGFEFQMIKMIDELKLNDKVMVIKNPPREDVIGAYKQSKFLVLPSRWELSPLTPLEGFAFKKPVISTTAHGIPHTIENEKHGLLVESENYHALANAILELLSNEKKIEEYGYAGYCLVHEVCNSKIMAKNTLKIYEEITNR